MVEWITTMTAAGNSGNTIRQRHDVIARLSEFMGDRDPWEASGQDVASFLARPGLMPSSRAAYFRALKAWFDFCVNCDIIDRNPMRRMKPPRVDAGEPRPIDTGDLYRAIDSADGDLLAWLLLGAGHGLRVHEIAQTRGEDFKHGEQFVLGKGQKPKYQPVHPAVESLRGRYPSRGFWFPAGRPGTALPHVRPETVTRKIGEHLRMIGCDDTPHSLRHWYGTQLQERHGDSRLTQTLLRHSSLTSTQIYTRVSDARKHAAVAALPLLPQERPEAQGGLSA